MYYNDFMQYYMNNSIMLFDKYVANKLDTKKVDIKEERTNYIEHFVQPMHNFLDRLKTYGFMYTLFNRSFMKLNIINDEDLFDKQYDDEYFAAMYFAKFTLDVYNKDYKEGTFGEVVASIIYFFDKGCYVLDELHEVLKLDVKIRDIYQGYVNKCILRNRRRKIIRKDIRELFIKESQKFIGNIPECNKLDINNVLDNVKIAKLTKAADKMLSFIKTLAVISFEVSLGGINWDATKVKCHLYKDMWECGWDTSFNKNKAMSDFKFIFYKIYYRFIN